MGEPILEEPKLDENSNVREFELPDRPILVTSVGESLSGKSYLTRFWIDQGLKNGRYQLGIVFSPLSQGTSDDWNFLPSHSVFQHYDNAILDQYLTMLKKLKQKTGEYPQNFIVFDDAVGSIDQSRGSWFQHWISTYRHYNSDVWLNVQYIYRIDPLIREQCTHYFAFFTGRRDSLEALWKTFGANYGDIREFRSLFQKLTYKKHTCLLYDKAQTFEGVYNEETDEYKISPFLMSSFKVPEYKVGRLKKYPIE